MNRLLFVALMACGSSSPKPDAQVQDWYWAWNQYVDVWCSWYERCEPSGFKYDYGTHARCVSDNLSGCDITFGQMQCMATFPDDRKPKLQQCLVDVAADNCSSSAPQSCVDAIVP